MTTTTTAPSLPNPEADELVELAQKIRAWQESKKLSTAELLRRLPGIGSDKTFGRILKGDLAELDTQRWVSDYRAVWAVIESMTGRERDEVELYEDLSTVVALRRALAEIFEARSIRRVIIVEGDSGLGKSSALAHMQRKWGQRLIIVEAQKAWDDNPNCLLEAILDALGCKDQPLSRAGRLRMAISMLRRARTALAIDEAHHLGPACIDTVKGLINQTPGEVVLLALPTLWARLLRAANEEVRQIAGNRLAERVKLGQIREADVRKLLVRRLGLDDPASTKAVLAQVHKLAADGRPHGNLSFVDAVCERVRDQEISPVTHDAVLAGIAAELARR